MFKDALYLKNIYIRMYKMYGMYTDALNLMKTDKILLEGDKMGKPHVIDMDTYHKAFDDGGQRTKETQK